MVTPPKIIVEKFSAHEMAALCSPPSRPVGISFHILDRDGAQRNGIDDGRAECRLGRGSG